MDPIRSLTVGRQPAEDEPIRGNEVADASSTLGLVRSTFLCRRSAPSPMDAEMDVAHPSACLPLPSMPETGPGAGR
jgi:hypothetical protein